MGNIVLWLDKMSHLQESIRELRKNTFHTMDELTRGVKEVFNNHIPNETVYMSCDNGKLIATTDHEIPYHFSIGYDSRLFNRIYDIKISHVYFIDFATVKDDGTLIITDY